MNTFSVTQQTQGTSVDRLKGGHARKTSISSFGPCALTHVGLDLKVEG